jgi:L-alanine-DL-glutamate epimerase-like enolase superfamily enzyme
MSSLECRVRELRWRELRIPFKEAFRHASAERAETSSVWVEAVSAAGHVGAGESCPRPYVTGETTASVQEFIAHHEAAVRGAVTDIDSLRAWVSAHRAEIDAHPAAWCALELSLLDLFGKARHQPVEAVLSRPLLAGVFRYTAILGDSSPDAFGGMVERYWRMGFRDYKVKLSGDVGRDREKLRAFDRWPEGSYRLRADANNLWSSADEAAGALERMAVTFFAVEEPIAKGRYAALASIASRLGCRLVLDESIAAIGQLDQLSMPASQWLVNVRVSKMGGLLRALQFVDAAAARGLSVIVGAHVGETSLLTRAALTVAHAAGATLVAQEGAFGTHLLEKDVCDPPLMFGPGGIIDASHPALNASGLIQVPESPTPQASEPRGS